MRWLALAVAPAVRGLWVGLGLGWGDDDADLADGNAGGLEVGDTVIVGVAHVDGLLEEKDEFARLLGEEAAGALFVVGDEVVGDAAAGTGELVFKGAVEGSRGEGAPGVGSGLEGGYGERHAWF